MQPPSFTVTPNADYSFISSPLVINCAAGGSPSPTINFYRNNVLILTTTSLLAPVSFNVGSTSLSISVGLGGRPTMEDIRSGIDGWYTCVAANTAGSVFQDFSVVVQGKCGFINHFTEMPQPPRYTLCTYTTIFQFFCA